jgi:putative CocE/NonD family hydrolase
MTLLSRLAAHLLRLPPPVNAKVVCQRDIAVPMRDGTILLADRWSSAGPGPVVLVRTPYGRSGPFALIYRLFAERGLQVVVQSCRGTGGSGGRLDPMRQEAADGLDTLDWVRAQPWFTGTLYTYGSSYVGFTQWAVAQEAGRRIDGMVLHVTLSNFRNETLGGGGFTLEGSLGWTRLIKSLARGEGMRMKPIPRSLFSHLPLGDLDRKALGETVDWWQDWVGHPDPEDSWWQAVDHSAKAARIAAPVAMVTGWRDIFLPTQIADFTAMQGAGVPTSLTIGPWSHDALGGFAESIRQAVALFGADTRKDRVRLYLQGAGEWRDYAAWPPPGATERALYLCPGASLADAPAAGEAEPARYVYDPADPTPSLHGARLSGGKKLPDMSPIEARGDTLSFTGPPLETDLDVIGPVRATVHVRCDRAHFDLFLILCDVDKQGRPLHVSDGYLRLTPDLFPPDADGVRRIDLSCWPTAYRFRAGHRIRLIVASGAHPRYVRNLGTGEPLATATAMAPATIEIFQDAARPSAVAVYING